MNQIEITELTELDQEISKMRATEKLIEELKDWRDSDVFNLSVTNRLFDRCVEVLTEFKQEKELLASKGL